MCFAPLQRCLKSLLPTMKIQILSTLFVATVFLCGCSSTKFTEYHGSEVFQGTGGEVRVVDGIDFWENGDSNRKYKILASLKKATSADTCPDTLTDSFQILATERRPSPKPHTNREETQSFSCPETKGNPTWISLAMGITSDPRSWWSSSMWMSLSPNFEPLRIVYTTTTDDFSAVPTTAPAAAMPASTQPQPKENATGGYQTYG